MNPTFLIKGGNSRYYFRIKIPADLRPIIGQGEVRRSLKTTNKMLAMARSLQMAYAWHQQFEKLRMSDLDDILNNPLNRGLITFHNMKIGNEVAEKITLDTEKDVVNFKKHLVGFQATPPPAPDTPENSNSFADRPISFLIQDYLDENKEKWTSATYLEYKALFREAIKLVGDIPVRAVTRQRARGLKNTMQGMRRNGKPLSFSTINKTLGKMSSVWSYGIKENLGIPDRYNPWSGLQITSKKAQSAEQPAYEISDLEQLFSVKLVESKTINNRPARYWVPVLSLFHGLRIGEAAQQSIDTVFEDDGIWCMRVTGEMRSKTKNSVRTIPIHSKVIELGFLDFVDWRRKSIEKSKSADRRLFVDLKPEGARCAGPVSTWWNGRYTPQFNLTPETSLHSLRHTCITWMRANGSNSATHRAEIAGHVRGDTQCDVRYGKTVLEPLQQVMESLQYPITIPPWSEVKIKRLYVAK